MEEEIREEYVNQLLEKISHRAGRPAATDEIGGQNLAGGSAGRFGASVSGPAPIDSEPPSVGGQRNAGTDATRDSQEPASDTEIEHAKQSGESELMLVVDQEYVQILREYDVSDDKMSQTLVFGCLSTSMVLFKIQNFTLMMRLCSRKLQIPDSQKFQILILYHW